LSVWFDKCEGQEREQSIAAELGIVLEPWLLSKVPKWFEVNEGVAVDVHSEPHMLLHPDHPYLTCNLDGKILHPERGWGVVEVKTAGEWKRTEWGEDELPDAYFVQVQHQLCVTGWAWAAVPFLLGNRKFDVRIVERNETVIDMIIERAGIFWAEFVEKKIPPAPIGEDPDTATLKLLYPGGDEEVLDLSNMQAEYDRYKSLQETYKDTEKAMEELKQTFMLALGDHEISTVGEKKVTWKTQTRKAYTKVVKAGTSRVFRI